MEESPDIDAVFLNAGVQGSYDLADPQAFKLAAFNEEVKINFSSLVALTHAFLPYLQKKAGPTSFILCVWFFFFFFLLLQAEGLIGPPLLFFISTGSNLAIVPAATLPAYSASKAALNVFTLCLREQLRHSSTRVIEISPPPVQSKCNQARFHTRRLR